MIIERSDRVCHICEIKFARATFTINKQDAKNLRHKIYQFSSLPQNKRKTMFLTMITPYGIAPNEYKTEMVQNEIELTALFTG